MIGADGAALTYDNADSNNASFLRYVLRPYLVYGEGALAIDTDFFGARGWNYPRFDTSEVLRPTQQERFALYQVAIASGFMTAEQAAALEAAA
jgi:phage portal protein BeeE